MAAATGERPPELRTPECPAAVAYLLQWFAELSRGRPVGMGLAPLSWCEIDAWSRLTGTRLQHWELRALLALDGAWLRAAAKGRPKPAARAPAQPPD